jgi:hypothetical protein
VVEREAAGEDLGGDDHRPRERSGDRGERGRGGDRDRGSDHHRTRQRHRESGNS